MNEKRRSVRTPMDERWDLIPGGWQALKEVAGVSDYGSRKWGHQVWKGSDISTDEAPLNHALSHAFKALEYPEGSLDRIRQLAKAAWNLLAQIWFEKHLPHQVIDWEELSKVGSEEAQVAKEPEPPSFLERIQQGTSRVFSGGDADE